MTQQIAPIGENTSHAPLSPAGINPLGETWPVLDAEAEVALRLGDLVVQL